MQEALDEFSPRFMADPQLMGGSMSRIYHDSRFSKGKASYENNVGIRFDHESASQEQPGPSVHIRLEPERSSLGVGLCKFGGDGSTLTRIRNAIVADPQAWKRVTRHEGFSEWRFTGESLRRAPEGFDPDHPMIEDLRRKSCMVGVSLKEQEVCNSAFADRLRERLGQAMPFARLASEIVGCK